MVYSVFRIDGESAAVAKRSVDLALAAEQNGVDGQGCFDRIYGDISGVASRPTGLGDWWIYRTAQFFTTAGLAVTEDQNSAEFGTSPAAPRCDNVAG